MLPICAVLENYFQKPLHKNHNFLDNLSVSYNQYPKFSKFNVESSVLICDSFWLKIVYFDES